MIYYNQDVTSSSQRAPSGFPNPSILTFVIPIYFGNYFIRNADALKLISAVVVKSPLNATHDVAITSTWVALVMLRTKYIDE